MTLLVRNSDRDATSTKLFALSNQHFNKDYHLNDCNELHDCLYEIIIITMTLHDFCILSNVNIQNYDYSYNNASSAVCTF